MSAYAQGDLSIRESLWDKIKDIDALETYVSSNSGMVEVTQKEHAWVIDPLAAVTTQAGTVELADTTYAATNPTVLQNTTQIIEYGFKVSKTNQNSDHAAFESKFAREKVKKMKQWKNQLELSAVIGTRATATGTAERKMAGMVRFASTLKTQKTTVTLTSDHLNTHLGDAWTAGAEHEVILVGKALKNRISGFTVGNTRNVNAEEAMLVGRVDVYDSDHGRIKIVKHRYIDSAAATTAVHCLTSYIPDYVLIGALDEVHYEDRPNSGYFMAGSVVGEYTVQVANEKAVSFIDGIV